MNETLLITGLLSLTVVAVGLTYWLVKHHYDKQLQWLKRDRKEKDLLVSAAQLQATPKFLDEVQAVIERLAKSGATDEHARHVEQYLDYSRRLLASIGVPARSVVIPGSYQKHFPAGDYSVSCALIIGQRKESTDKKTSLNEALRLF